MISTTNTIRAFALTFAVALLAAAPTATPSPTPAPTTVPITLPPMPAPDCKPTPSPVPIGGNVLPAPGQNRCVTITPAKKGAKPTPTPPPARVGLTGVWEVQIQPGGDIVDYVHFKLTQTGDALVGTYLDKKNKPYPLAGVVKGANVRIVVTLPKGGSLVFSGSVSGTTDMIGMMTGPSGEIAFTAAYRAKSNLFDNIAPGAGLGGLGGGYNPPR